MYNLKTRMTQITVVYKSYKIILELWVLKIFKNEISSVTNKTKCLYYFFQYFIADIKCTSKINLTA